MSGHRSKCRSCGEIAVIDLPRHNAHFCREHFLQLCRRQVERAVKDFDMCSPGDRLLVAASGGKDSLAVWDLLVDMGYKADGYYIDLGIGDYSANSARQVQGFANERNLTLLSTNLRDHYDFDIPTAAMVTNRVPCSACGMSKRHLFDKAALDGGYDAIVTGHNLDDEVAVLFGNVLRWDIDYLARQRPVLPARKGFPKKIKPLIRLTERETAAWCLLRDIDYLVEECPIAAGNRHLRYKNVLNEIEAASPSTKAAFYFEFLDKMAPLLDGWSAADAGLLEECSKCGAPTTGKTCAFCRLVDRADGHEPVPVEATLTRSRRVR